jgi:hypothetical protein
MTLEKKRVKMNRLGSEEKETNHNTGRDHTGYFS